MKVKSVMVLSMLWIIINFGAYSQSNTNNGESSGYLGSNNTSIGYFSNNVVTSSGNSSLGSYSGLNLSTGENNVFIGFQAGNYTTTGRQNVFVGYQSGYTNTGGYHNTFAGVKSGFSNTIGYYNTSIGYYSGYSNSQGTGNSTLGYYAGKGREGSNNVFIGYRSGNISTQTQESDKLFIENTQAADPLIWGDFSDGTLSFFGSTGIQTRNVPDTLDLLVDGLVVAKEGLVMRNDFPDYVFESDYDLWKIDEIRSFIETHNHLPGIPGADQVEASGLRVGDLQVQLLRKIEELTLYLIEIEKENLLIEERIYQLKSQNE